MSGTNAKLSDLTAASALAGDESFYVVQSGNSRKTTINDIALDPGVTGVSSPYISQRDALRTMLNASMIKLAGDGATDDQPEIMNVVTDISGWGGGKFLLNHRRANTSYALGASIELPSNVFLEGDGIDTSGNDSELKALGDYPVITQTGTILSGRTAGGVRDITIRGGGKANTNAHGIKLEWSNRFCMERVRFFSCRDALNYHDVWQVWADKLSVDGEGADQSLRGFHATGHDAANPNNAIIASNCIIQNVEGEGFRLQYFNGSKFVNCEVAGAGSHGWYLGAPDTNTGAVMWGHFSNILADTCVGDNFRIEKGSADDVKQIQVNGLWCGTSDLNGISVFDASLIEMTGIKVANTDKYGMYFARCSRMDVSGFNVDTFDRLNAGWQGVVLDDCAGMGLSDGAIYASDRSSVKAVVEAGTSNLNRIINVDVRDHGITRLGAGTIIQGCTGHKTHNSGSADLTVGNASVTVTHSLAETPANGDIMIVPRFDINAGGVARYWVDTLTSTTFKINVNTAVTGSNIAFSWTANIERG